MYVMKVKDWLMLFYGMVKMKNYVLVLGFCIFLLSFTSVFVCATGVYNFDTLNVSSDVSLASSLI